MERPYKGGEASQSAWAADVAHDLAALGERAAEVAADEAEATVTQTRGGFRVHASSSAVVPVAARSAVVRMRRAA
jgi:hypothetical protein